MTIEFRDLDGGIGVNLVVNGVVYDDEIISAFKSHMVDNRDKLKNYRYSIPDYSGVTKIKFTSKAIYTITDLCRDAEKVNPDLVVAIVVKKDTIYGIARMHQMLLNEKFWESSIMENLEEAKNWVKGRVKEKFEIDGLTFT